jgi:RNA polymerase primary sigma factor
MEGRTIFMAKKKENVTEEIKVQESTVKAPVKKAAAKKVKESETKTQSDADIENEEALKAQELAEKFDEKCNGLLAIAKKKKNVLDYQEIMNYFLDTDFEADKMEKCLRTLKKMTTLFLMMKMKLILKKLICQYLMVWDLKTL